MRCLYLVFTVLSFDTLVHAQDTPAPTAEELRMYGEWLNSKDPQEVADGITAIAPFPQAVKLYMPNLLQLSESKERVVQRALLRAIPTMQGSARPLFPFLKRSILSDNYTIEQCGIGALSHLGKNGTSVGEELLPYLRGDEACNADFRIRLAWLLTEVLPSHPEFEKTLLKLLKDDSLLLRATAAQILGIKQKPLSEVVEKILLEGLRSTDRNIRNSCLTSIRKFSCTSSSLATAIIKLLPTIEDDLARQYAVESLRKVEGKDVEMAIPSHLTLLTDKHALIRLRAAENLGQWGLAAKTALPALQKALDDPDRFVRCAAAYAQYRTDPKTIDQTVSVLVATLEEARNTETKYHSLYAIEQLKSIGPPAKKAIPHLNWYAEHPNSELHTSAVQALQKIRP